MAISLRDSFHTSLCESFYSDLISGRENFYYFIGGVLPWNVNDLPPEYVGTVEEEMSVRNDIVSIKKVTPSDIAYGIKRYDWESGITYDMYDSTISMHNKKFYVLTDEFNVYKCIGSNGPSTEKPVGVDYQPQYYADGYWWKYMYSIPKSLRNKFLLNDVMPVFRSIQDAFYDNGNISDIVVKNGGSGYQEDTSVTVIVNGTSTTTAVIKAIVGTNGHILAAKVIDGGSGYNVPPTLQIIANQEATGFYPGNNSAILEPIMLNGSIDKILIRDQGKFYSSDIRTTISVLGDGEGAVLIPFIDNGEIIDVIIQDQGFGYTFANLQVVSALDPITNIFPGSGAVLTANLSLGNLDSVQAIVEQTALPGAIYTTKIISGGQDYFLTPSLSIDGDGTGFAAIPIIVSGQLTGLTITNPGQGYSYCNINLVPNGSGYGAVIKSIISPTGGHGRNAIYELNANSIILSSSINNDPIQGIIVENDYRQYGLIKNIKFFEDSRNYNRQLGSGCFKIKLNDVSNIQKDSELIIGMTKKFIVIDKSNFEVLVKAINNKKISVGDTGTVLGFNNAFTVLEVTDPDINKYTGSLQYVNNQMAIEYSGQQSLTLRTVITL